MTKYEVEAAKIDKYIVDRVKAVLCQLKQCRSEEERVDYHTILTGLAPERVEPRAGQGMIRKVSARLHVERGSRYNKKMGETRHYAFDQAITSREKYDEAAALCGELQPGDKATSRGQSCTVIEIDHEADTCKLGFAVGGIEATRDFSCIYKGKNPPKKAPFVKGSARLHRAPPSLRPKAREARSDEKAEAARPKVEELFDTEGARSPAQRDQVRRRLGVGLYEKAQALIVYATNAALYTLFCLRFPAHQISFATFKKLRPWYTKRAKEESCLCKHCDNFKQQQTPFHSLAQLFQPLLDASPAADADDAPDDDEASAAAEWAGQAALRKLLEFSTIKSKSEMVKFVLCSGAFDGAGKLVCIDGTCSKCGFCQLWSTGLRRHVVDGDGNLLPSAPVEFQSEVKWIRIKSSKTVSPGESKASSYEERRGTIVQFFDEFERETIRKFPQHRFTIQRQKAMDAEFQRNRWPGWLQFDIDFAMDGTIPPPEGRSMQADHWSPMSYTLFVNIVSWLRTDAWLSRTSDLSKGDVVTVEPADASQPGSTEPAAGSEWAEIVAIPAARSAPDDPELRRYGVRRHGAASDALPELVERRYLRHRKLHTKAFIHVSDDKTHDSEAAKTFIGKTLTHLDEHYVKMGKEKFVALHMHSDNAPSHFKNCKTLHFLTTLPERLRPWASVPNRSFRVLWEFGAPGHGKGVWDGIGAWMKRTVRQDVVDHRPNKPTILAPGARILNPRHVYEHLKVSSAALELYQM